VTITLKEGSFGLVNETKVDIFPQEFSCLENNHDFLNDGLMSVIRFRYIDSFNMRYIMTENDESMEHSWEWRCVRPRDLHEAVPSR
jgi:hypothetical protein